MRLSNAQAVARPLPFDRNGIPRVGAYNAGAVAPHGTTTRWSYTVPAGKKAYITALVCKMIRDGTATTAGVAQCFINYTPSGGASATVALAQMANAAIGATDSMAFSPQEGMMPGDLLAGVTNDPSTGGSINFANNFTGMEFDA